LQPDAADRPNPAPPPPTTLNFDNAHQVKRKPCRWHRASARRNIILRRRLATTAGTASRRPIPEREGRHPGPQRPNTTVATSKYTFIVAQEVATSWARTHHGQHADRRALPERETPHPIPICPRPPDDSWRAARSAGAPGDRPGPAVRPRGRFADFPSVGWTKTLVR
jgi:hypothetical protein